MVPLGSLAQGSGLRELQQGERTKGVLFVAPPPVGPLPASIQHVGPTVLRRWRMMTPPPPTHTQPSTPNPPCLEHGAVWDGGLGWLVSRLITQTHTNDFGFATWSPGDACDAHTWGAADLLEICCHPFFGTSGAQQAASTLRQLQAHLQLLSHLS